MPLENDVSILCMVCSVIGKVLIVTLHVQNAEDGGE